MAVNAVGVALLRGVIVVPVYEFDIVRDAFDGDCRLPRIIIAQERVVTRVEAEEHVAVGCRLSSVLGCFDMATGHLTSICKAEVEALDR